MGVIVGCGSESVQSSAGFLRWDSRLPVDVELDGRLGCWGWFEQGSLPRLEVLGLSVSMGVSLRGHLRIVRVSSGSTGGMDGGSGGASWG